MNFNDEETLARDKAFMVIVLIPLFVISAAISMWIDEFLPGYYLAEIVFFLPLVWMLYFYIRLYQRSKKNNFKPYPIVDAEKVTLVKVIRDFVFAIMFMSFATFVIFVVSDWGASWEPDKYVPRDFLTSLLIALGVSLTFLRRAYISFKEYRKNRSVGVGEPDVMR